LVVAHPVLVGILKGKKNLFYQHGEIAVPGQAVVKGADCVFVPTDNCSGPFLRGGYNPDQIIETGLCLEPKLAKQSRSAYDERIERLNESSTLTGAFFTSGAEPKPHIQKIYEAVITIAKSNGKALVFAHRNGKLHHLLKSKIEKMEYGSAVKIFPYSDREELDNLTAAHFNEFDYFVSPSHERTNWALGLGLPMFILDPPIGPFSPINRNFLLESGVAISVDFRTAEEFYWALDYHRKSGSLLRMSRAGWNRFPIDGFQTIADFLVNKLPLNT
jgi:hypothetical protein